MPKRGEVLVAIINSKLDFAILREELWYRIPVSSVKEWLAFYQTSVLDSEKHSISYFAEVVTIRKVLHRQLFPNDPLDKRAINIIIKTFFISPTKYTCDIMTNKLGHITWKVGQYANRSFRNRKQRTCSDLLAGT
jgi:hypothetical protein